MVLGANVRHGWQWMTQMPIKDKTLRQCSICEAMWRGQVFCPLCDEPTGEMVEETAIDVYFEVMFALMPKNTRHDN